jgi:hypothetical protein
MMATLSSLNFGALEDAPELLTQKQLWLQQRRGKFTASEFHKLMTNGKAKDSMGQVAKTHIAEKAVELLTEFDPSEERYISPAMQWGLDHEAEAVQAFAEYTGFKPHMTGQSQEFIGSSCGQYGATPDGLIADYAGLEIKCPNSITHMIYADVTSAETLLEIEPRYYWQIQGSMLVTGREKWWFASYDPRFICEESRLYIACIDRVEADIERLSNRLNIAIKERDKLVNIALSR